MTKWKETEIGKIPEDWDICKLGDYLIIKGRIGWKGLKKSEFSEVGECMIINGPNIKDGKIDFNECMRIPKWRYDESPEIMLKQKDILMTKDGTIGKTAYVDYLPKPASVASGIFVIRNNSKELNQKYLYFVLTSQYFKNLIISRTEGSVIPHLYQRDITELKIPLPSLIEQDKIAKILSDLDSKIELNNQMNATLEAMAQAIFKHWFIDFEFPDENGKPYKSSGGELVDSELGKIPEGWKIRTVKDLGRVICGKTPPTKNKENYGGDTPFITIPDMHGNTYIIKTERYLSEIGASTQQKKEIPPSSVCVSCIATPGIVVLTSERSHTNQQINSIIPTKDIGPYYVYLTMKDKSKEIKQMGLGGTTTLNLNTGDFERIKIIIPTESVLLKFNTLVKSIFEQLLSNSRQNSTLQNSRESLLPKLMSGKIRVQMVVSK